MERGGGGGGGEVVELEDAVKLPRGALRTEEALAPEAQGTVARQVHATVLLYNYYHRKQFPQLDFADPKRFCMSASLAASDGLFVYLNQVHDHRGNGAGAGLSVTDRAVVDACDIAEALDATKDSPEMIMWPISKVAVLLLDRTRKRCLIEYGSQTKGVWSILEKDIKTSFGGPRSSDLSVQGSSNKSVPLPSEPYMLQQIAYSEVELKTGMKRTNLRFLEEHLVCSLSQKGTTTKLFVVQYEETVNSKLKEMPLKALIGRMSGPIFKSDPYPIMTSVVECYHILPYKEVLLNLLNREWHLDSSLTVPKEQSFRNGKSSLHSEIDESLKEQEANRKSKMKKITTHGSAPRKSKQVAKAVGNSATTNCSTSKNRKNNNVNCKRKIEAFRAIPAAYAEHQDGKNPTKENDSLAVPDVENLVFESSSVNAKGTKATNGGFVDIKANVQMDDDRTEQQSMSKNMPQDIFPVKAPEVDPVIKNHALENKKEKVTEKSGGITDNNDQMYESLQSLQKMRDDTLREHCMLGDRSAQFDMDIQTILTEGQMTPKVKSILKRYEDNRSILMEVANPNYSGEGWQTMNIKRKRLKEAGLLRNKCQELDDICRENNWILPRYKVLPSVTDEMYQASVYLTGPDFSFSVDGDMESTPRGARDSAASNMLHQLHLKAKEN